MKSNHQELSKIEECGKLVGKRIAQLRKEKGWNQADLAAESYTVFIRLSGMKQQAVRSLLSMCLDTRKLWGSATKSCCRISMMDPTSRNIRRQSMIALGFRKLRWGKMKNCLSNFLRIHKGIQFANLNKSVNYAPS